MTYFSSPFQECPPRQNPAKKSGSTRSEFCEILSPTPPAFRKISLAFRICISAHHILFKRLCGVQSVLPHFCFSRSSVLRTEALQRAGNACGYCQLFLIKQVLAESYNHTKTEQSGFFETKEWACRRHAHSVCPDSAGGFRNSGALARTNLFWRRRFGIQCNFYNYSKRIFDIEYFLIYWLCTQYYQLVSRNGYARTIVTNVVIVCLA